MANDKFLIGLFDHEDNLVSAIRAFKKAGIEITDCLTPFPLHGLEHELGYKDTRLHTAGFFFGLTGMTVALTIMTWISTSNYPLNIGGKPHFALPSFIPITFELTVLFAAVGMVIVYCIRNGLYPGNVPRIFDERITDDRFALTFEMDENLSSEKVSEIVAILNEAGAVEVKTKEFEEDGEIFEVITNEVSLGSTSVKTKHAAVKNKVTAPKLTAEQIEEGKQKLLSRIGAVADGEKDDLKLVKGIGPVYEGKLNEFGIYTFNQLSKIDAEMAHLIEELTGFPGRVEREDWVGQAKQLLNK
jgi:predicted flap endonuclease-1-like 5' DNA nuclease